MELKEIKNPAPERVIESVRLINASKEKMFEAWTNPAHLKNWWGPNGFTNTFQEFDLKPGGKWEFIMHGPDGVSYPNECIFIRIEKPDLLIWNHLHNPIFQIQARFEEVAGMTNVSFKMIFESPEKSNALRAFVSDKNEENFNRLELELLKMR